MNNSSTESGKRQMSDMIKKLYFVATDLEDAGISINNAQAAIDGPSILIYAHEEAFLKWAAPRRKRITVTELDKHKGWNRYENRWEISMDMAGVEVHGYLTDDEKEAWEHEMDPRDPA